MHQSAATLGSIGHLKNVLGNQPFELIGTQATKQKAIICKDCEAYLMDF